uniref:MARVEL domain-containing protein n=1 Tax=Timema poppense TaxID=170557 RepID=A0A7R9GXP8_TIMPO|nr:unnamed protein product [Timema poppensis]
MYDCEKASTDNAKRVDIPPLTMAEPMSVTTFKALLLLEPLQNYVDEVCRKKSARETKKEMEGAENRKCADDCDDNVVKCHLRVTDQDYSCRLRNLPRVEALSIMLRIEGNLTQASDSVGTAIVDQLLRLLKQKSNRSDGNTASYYPFELYALSTNYSVVLSSTAEDGENEVRISVGIESYYQFGLYVQNLNREGATALSLDNNSILENYHYGMPIQPAMGAKFGVFKEPRGVMRILQFIFSICAFATTTGFTSFILLNITCGPSESSEVGVNLEYSYPFRLDHVQQQKKCSTNVSDPEAFTLHTFHLVGDFSSDAQFFVATGVLSLIYSFLIGIVYVLFDAKYQSNELLPLTDFILTVTLSVFWLSGSAAWANGLTGLKGTTSSIISSKQCLDICKSAKVGSVSGLNISIMLGFLNFFLWASDLWFLYKETSWFKLKQGSSGVDSAA